MSLIKQLRAHVCRSTTVAVELAVKNPEKNLSFAKNLITAKNRSNSAALTNAEFKLRTFGLSQDQVTAARVCLSFEARTRGVRASNSFLQDLYQKHQIAESRVEALERKQQKYTALANELITVS